MKGGGGGQNWVINVVVYCKSLSCKTRENVSQGNNDIWMQILTENDQTPRILILIPVDK